MFGKRRWIATGVIVLGLVAGVSMMTGARTVVTGFREAWGSRYAYPPGPDLRSTVLRATRQGNETTGRIRYWNRLAIDASGLDHTPPAPGEQRAYGEQLGPGRSGRAIAIVQIAVFDVVNAFGGGHRSFTGLEPALPGTSMDAAIAQAAHDTLVALFPAQAARLDELLAEDLGRIGDGSAKSQGIALGRLAAAAILDERADDGSDHGEPRAGTDYPMSDQPGKWRPDPISRGPLAMGAYWMRVRPFVMTAPEQFRAPPPPPMESAEYAAAYQEVVRLGGDGAITPTERTQDQTFAGIYWAYDGTPSLCAPPRLYNQVALAVADQAGGNKMTPIRLARLLALVNLAMADAGIAVWDSKYFYDCWRPVTGIREADPGTGPTGMGDGNGATFCDLTFTPLGAPASNLSGPNFTPPFPSYPSGHAGFGGALFQVLRDFYGTDEIPFTFVSDEYNGITRGNDGSIRPLVPRSFKSLSEAEEENGQSRIYLGIHWSFDKTEGIAQGRRVADWVFQHAFQPCQSAAPRC